MEDASPLARAVRHFKGSQAALARAAGVSQPAMHKAIKAGRVSAELAIKIEQATDGTVPRQELRPDLWNGTAPDCRAPNERATA